MEDLLAREADEIAAVIVEPLVQCAGGMRMYDPVYLTLLRDACDRHGVHLILDEIAVGFGRTGTLFACEQAGISPDFLCLSKGLTGGYLPLSVVLTGEDVYAAFYADHAAQRAFLHSHSYTANPLACAAACATLRIFAREPVLVNNERLAVHLARRLAPLAGHPRVAEVRQTGLIAAIECVVDRSSRAPWPPEERRGWRVHRYALEHGVLLRPLGNVVYFMPPYVITDEEINLMVDVATAAIERACE
jgi:adenosylmethionine-8-amino-7-oxononanoate aminotransferase